MKAVCGLVGSRPIMQCKASSDKNETQTLLLGTCAGRDSPEIDSNSGADPHRLGHAYDSRQ